MADQTVTGMPAAYEPLQPDDVLQLNGCDAVVINPDQLGLVVVQVAVPASDLTWVGRYR